MARRPLAALALLTVLAAPALAQPADGEATQATAPAAKLKAGDPAPAFKVEKFLKGKEFSSFEKGRVYVVEFWATWCGPCIASMPHLSELQKQYKDITICGVDASEREWTPENLEMVTKFVADKGENMAYTVAYDGASRHMSTNWMRASGAQGIPTAFVVDKTGTVAWIGHPMFLDMVLDGVTKGNWDPATGPARTEKAGKAFEDALDAYKTSYSSGEAAWAAAIKDYPALAPVFAGYRFGAVVEGGNTAEAATIGRAMLKDATEHHHAGPINDILSGLRDPAKVTTPDLKALLLDTAKANFEMGDKTQYAIYVPLAQAYYLSGDKEKGQEAAQKAIELAPEKTRARIEAYLKKVEEGK